MLSKDKHMGDALLYLFGAAGALIYIVSVRCW